MRRQKRKEERGIEKLRMGEGGGRDEGGRRWQTTERKTNLRPMETVAEWVALRHFPMRERDQGLPASNRTIGWLAGGLTVKPEERGNRAAIEQIPPMHKSRTSS